MSKAHLAFGIWLLAWPAAAWNKIIKNRSFEEDNSSSKFLFYFNCQAILGPSAEWVITHRRAVPLFAKTTRIRGLRAGALIFVYSEQNCCCNFASSSGRRAAECGWRFLFPPSASGILASYRATGDQRSATSDLRHATGEFFFLTGSRYRMLE
jgi:hypothetical protein